MPHNVFICVICAINTYIWAGGPFVPSYGETDIEWSGLALFSAERCSTYRTSWQHCRLKLKNCGHRYSMATPANKKDHVQTKWWWHASRLHRLSPHARKTHFASTSGQFLHQCQGSLLTTILSGGHFKTSDLPERKTGLLNSWGSMSWGSTCRTLPLSKWFLKGPVAKSHLELLQ